jgi:hypothetical protein
MSNRSSRSFTHRSRERIKAAKLEDKLIQFVNGEIELSRPQVAAASKLLDKVMPNLRAVEVKSTEPENRNPREMTDEELLLELYRSPSGEKIVRKMLKEWRSDILNDVGIKIKSG